MRVAPAKPIEASENARCPSYKDESQTASPPRPGSTGQHSARFWAAGTRYHVPPPRQRTPSHTPPAWPTPWWAVGKKPLLLSEKRREGGGESRRREKRSRARFVEQMRQRATNRRGEIALRARVRQLQCQSLQTACKSNMRYRRRDRRYSPAVGRVCLIKMSEGLEPGAVRHCRAPRASVGSEEKKFGCCSPALKRSPRGGEEG